MADVNRDLYFIELKQYDTITAERSKAWATA